MNDIFLSQWPFSYFYILSVVDQQPDGNDMSWLMDSTKLNGQELKWFMRKTDQNLSGWGTGNLISHLDLTKQAYIRDNSLSL